MDVKFPLAGYLRYLEAARRRTANGDEGLPERRPPARPRGHFARYIDPTAGTLDYVLVFIPNEQVYGFIHEHEATIAESALEKRVVLCSPLTLFAVLVVIRQSVDSVRMEEHANEILAALGAFRREWGKYQDAVLKVAGDSRRRSVPTKNSAGRACANWNASSTRWNNCGRGPGSDAGAELESGDAPEAFSARVDPTRR